MCWSIDSLDCGVAPDWIAVKTQKTLVLVSGKSHLYLELKAIRKYNGTKFMMM